MQRGDYVTAVVFSMESMRNAIYGWRSSMKLTLNVAQNNFVLYKSMLLIAHPEQFFCTNDKQNIAN